MQRESMLLGLSIPNWIAIFAIISTIGSWFITSYLSSTRDRHRKREEMRINYLTVAYENLVAAANRLPTESSARALEEAITKIQLFGTERRSKHCINSSTSTRKAQKQANRARR